MMSKYLGILLFLMANYLFDSFAPAKSTVWSCFFFSSMYFSLFLVVLDDAINDHGKITRSIYQAISSLFLARFTYELSLINLSYDDYILSANIYLSKILFFSVFILLILAIFIKNYKSWLRNLKNIGK